MNNYQDMLNRLVQNRAGSSLPTKLKPSLLSDYSVPPASAQIPKPPEYLFLTIRQLVKVTNLTEIEQYLDALEIELRLEREEAGDAVSIYDHLEKLLKKYTEALQVSSQEKSQAIFRFFNYQARIQKIKQLEELMLQEKWGKIEKVYLYKIPYDFRQGKAVAVSDERFLIIMVYQKTIDGRWVAVYSSPMEAYKANYCLQVIHARLLDRRGKLPEATPQSQLQKSKSLSFRLQIPAGMGIFIVDTNVLYKNHNFCSYGLSKEPYAIVITSPVLRELDKLKMSKGGRDKSIAILNTINSFSKKITDVRMGTAICKEKIRLFVFVFEPEPSTYILGFDKGIEDDRLIMTARAFSEANPQNPLTIVSQDSNVLLKSRAIQLKAVNLT